MTDNGEQKTIDSTIELAIKGIPFLLAPRSRKRYKIRLNVSSCLPRDNPQITLSLPRIRDKVGPMLAFGTDEHAKWPSEKNPLDPDARSIYDEIRSFSEVDLYSLRLSSKSHFKYAEIIALAGDLFSTFDELDTYPFSQEVWKNHAAISNYPYKIKAMGKLGKLNVFRLAAWQEVKRHLDLDSEFDFERYVIYYLWLALHNFSHFRLPTRCGEQVGLKRGGPLNAVDVYNQLHNAAIAEAKAAGYIRKRGPVGRGGSSASKERAFAMNAFADHFLTDLFATGHMRTPRHEVNYAIENLDDPLKNEDTAVAAHDRDNKNGLWVRSPCVCPGTEESHGDRNWYCAKPWKAFGDGQMDKPEAKEHFARINAAVNVSIYEINDAYNEGLGEKPSGNSYGHALQHVPIPYLPGISQDEMKNSVPWDRKYVMELRNFPTSNGNGAITKLAWESTGEKIKDEIKDGNTFPVYVVMKSGWVWQRLLPNDDYRNIYIPWEKAPLIIDASFIIGPMVPMPGLKTELDITGIKKGVEKVLRGY